MTDQTVSIPTPPPRIEPVAQISAVYDLTTRRVIQFTASVSAQDHSAHANAGVAVLTAMPTGSSTGYMIDDTLAAVPYVPVLADMRRSAIASAEAYFDGLIVAGFTYSNALYQIDQGAQANIAAMCVMALGSMSDPAGNPWPTGFYWIVADNSHTPMDATAMYAFGRAVAGYVSACVLRLRTIKDTIAAAANQAALDAIDVTAEYPAAAA